MRTVSSTFSLLFCHLRSCNQDWKDMLLIIFSSSHLSKSTFPRCFLNHRLCPPIRIKVMRAWIFGQVSSGKCVKLPCHWSSTQIPMTAWITLSYISNVSLHWGLYLQDLQSCSHCGDMQVYYSICSLVLIKYSKMEHTPLSTQYEVIIKAQSYPFSRTGVGAM